MTSSGAQYLETGKNPEPASVKVSHASFSSFQKNENEEWERNPQKSVYTRSSMKCDPPFEIATRPTVEAIKNKKILHP
ncbi:hypothetical protein Tco_1374576 [Tanacetum coccineum]